MFIQVLRLCYQYNTTTQVHIETIELYRLNSHTNNRADILGQLVIIGIIEIIGTDVENSNLHNFGRFTTCQLADDSCTGSYTHSHLTVTSENYKITLFVFCIMIVTNLRRNTHIYVLLLLIYLY